MLQIETRERQMSRDTVRIYEVYERVMDKWARRVYAEGWVELTPPMAYTFLPWDGN